MKKYEILKTIVGSQAHGLAEEGSDTDYRGVYVVPTSEILKLGSKIKGAHWMEGETEDNTAYEIGHFLHLATHCNPSILEVMVAPIVNSPDFVNGIELSASDKFNGAGRHGVQNYGLEMRKLLPYMWTPQQAFNALVGYGLNQRKKMLDNHLERWSKYGTAYLRTLWNLNDILSTGSFSLEIRDPNFKKELIEIRKGEWDMGRIINRANALQKEADFLLPACHHEQNLEKVNEFLLKVRKEFWE